MSWDCNRWGGKKVFFLCVFLGWLGAHRFHCNRTVTGYLYLLSLGGCFGLGVAIDLLLIAYGKFKIRRYKLADRVGYDNWDWDNYWDSNDVPVGYKSACWILSVIFSLPFLLIVFGG